MDTPFIEMQLGPWEFHYMALLEPEPEPKLTLVQRIIKRINEFTLL